MRLIVEIIYWLEWVYCKAYNACCWVDEEVVIPIRIRLFPDKRPQHEILADTRKYLRSMPAGKEVHAVLGHLDSAFPEEVAGAEDKS